jgi:hypothetical protein
MGFVVHQTDGFWFVAQMKKERKKNKRTAVLHSPVVSTGTAEGGVLSGTVSLTYMMRPWKHVSCLWEVMGRGVRQADPMQVRFSRE